MSTFPVLKTGAVIQFQTSRMVQFMTDVVQFMDGAEQRFRDYPLPFRRWIVTFDALDEAELHNIRVFVQQMNGAVGLFSFTDPWDGTVYSKCSMEADAVAESLTGPTQNGTSLVIREVRP